MSENTQFRVWSTVLAALVMGVCVAAVVYLIRELPSTPLWCSLAGHDPVADNSSRFSFGPGVPEESRPEAKFIYSSVLEVYLSTGEEFSIQFCRRCRQLYCDRYQPPRKAAIHTEAMPKK